MGRFSTRGRITSCIDSCSSDGSQKSSSSVGWAASGLLVSKSLAMSSSITTVEYLQTREGDQVGSNQGVDKKNVVLLLKLVGLRARERCLRHPRSLASAKLEIVTSGADLALQLREIHEMRCDSVLCRNFTPAIV